MPESMPEAYTDESPFTRRWRAAYTGEAGYAVVLEDSLQKTVGGHTTALTVAVCPSEEIAQYLAYFHNMLLKGNELLQVSTEQLLQAYATQTHPHEIRDATPVREETGGYL